MDKVRLILPLLTAVLIAALFAGLLKACSSLDAEKTAHAATQAAYARDKALWEANNAVAGVSINALQRQVGAAQARLDNYFKAEIARQSMIKDAVTRTRTLEEQREVVDDETRRKAADLLNTF